MGELLVQSYKGLWDHKGSVPTVLQEGAREPVAGWVLSTTCVLAKPAEQKGCGVKEPRGGLEDRVPAVS